MPDPLGVVQGARFCLKPVENRRKLKHYTLIYFWGTTQLRSVVSVHPAAATGPAAPAPQTTEADRAAKRGELEAVLTKIKVALARGTAADLQFMGAGDRPTIVEF
jgi:hypothetical protein